MELGNFLKYMFSELLNAGSCFKDFRVMLLRRFFSLNAPPTPYLLEIFFGSNWVQRTKTSI